MPLYEQFGISREGVDPAGQVRAAESCEQQVEMRTQDFRLDVSGLARNRSGAGVRFYLLDDYVSARKFGLASLAPAIEYFFGDWRNHKKTDLGTSDPNWWHDKESWMHVFSGALLWGTTLGEWEMVRKIAVYPDERRRIDFDDATPALRQLYVDLARLLRDQPVEEIGARVGKLSGADFHATDVLAKSLDAIAADDEALTNQLLNEFFLRRHKRMRSKSIMDSISPDGTTVVNFARHRGLEITLKPELELYYLRMPD
jgi:hypothetical protein